MTPTQHKARYRNGKRLRAIIQAWSQLPKKVRTTDVLLFGAAAARLDPEFVAEKVNDMLALAGQPAIEVDIVDAGDE